MRRRTVGIRKPVDLWFALRRAERLSMSVSRIQVIDDCVLRIVLTFPYVEPNAEGAVREGFEPSVPF